jgi:Domain of unknown function (DUF4168)
MIFEDSYYFFPNSELDTSIFCYHLLHTSDHNEMRHFVASILRLCVTLICLHSIALVVITLLLYSRVESASASTIEMHSLKSYHSIVGSKLQRINNNTTQDVDQLILQDILLDSCSKVVPSLFSGLRDSIMYNRYAACLAATEGLRRIRDQEITREQENRLKKLQSPRATKRAVSKIEKKFADTSNRLLSSLGMSPKEYNNLGKKIIGDEALTQKVSLKGWIMI